MREPSRLTSRAPPDPRAEARAPPAACSEEKQEHRRPPSPCAPPRYRPSLGATRLACGQRGCLIAPARPPPPVVSGAARRGPVRCGAWPLRSGAEMALHVPKAPGFAQMLKEGAKVSVVPGRRSCLRKMGWGGGKSQRGGSGKVLEGRRGRGLTLPAPRLWWRPASGRCGGPPRAAAQRAGPGRRREEGGAWRTRPSRRLRRGRRPRCPRPSARPPVLVGAGGAAWVPGGRRSPPSCVPGSCLGCEAMSGRRFVRRPPVGRGGQNAAGPCGFSCSDACPPPVL